MAGRIRAFDWARHPFGRPETWPQSLRSALGICLNSAFPTAIYWGPELRLLYNDAWSTIPGPRHPACLGQPAREVWSDIWHVIAPQFLRVIESGEGLFVDDQLLPMCRYGFEEETYWTYNFTPIRGDDGTIEGVFNSGHETTEKVLKNRQGEFLLRLSDDLRSGPEPGDTMQTICAALGPHLQAIRVGVRELEAARGAPRFPVTAEWTAEGTPRLGDRLPLDRLGAVAATLRAGHVARIDRAETHEDAGLRSLFREVGAAAALAVPWISQGALSAIVFVHMARPHRWSDEEVAMVEQVFERAIHAVERRRAVAREKAMAGEIDHRARNLLGVVRAIVRLNGGDDVEAYREKLLQRLTALSNTQTVLAEGQWVSASLREIVETELAPYRTDGAGRIRVEGPDLTVDPGMAQAISMAIHELTTNAAKHGALSTAEGSLAATWTAGAGAPLRIAWTEESPHLAAPAREGRSGFGDTLLRELLERQLRGTLSRHFSAGRFECVLTVPLAGPVSAQADADREAMAGGDAVPARGGRRMMVVEDDPVIAIDLEDRLEALGFSVVASADCLSAALSALDATPPDVAIIDVHLGGETSEPLAAQLRSRGIPFLQLTGQDAEPQPGSAFHGQPRLLKPFDDLMLKRELERVLAAGPPREAPPRPGAA